MGNSMYNFNKYAYIPQKNVLNISLFPFAGMFLYLQ